MNPFFSIIIPLYNKEDYIQETIKSVLNQTFTDFEVIVVDNGSSDRSLLKVKAFSDSRITLIHESEQGASAARNKGILSANSEFIALLDADDIWLSNHLEELKKLYEDYPNCGMYCNRYKIKISSKHFVNNSSTNSINDKFRGVIPDFFKASLVNRVAWTSSIMIPVSIIKKCGLFDTNITSGQDLDLWIRIAAHFKVAISNKITAIYRYEIPRTLSKTNFLSKRLIDFKKFETLEKQNKSLKQFLDLYRLEYAIQYRIGGAIKKSKTLLNQIDSKIPLKCKILLNSPPFILRLLLRLKHNLKKMGIDFTIYH